MCDCKSLFAFNNIYLAKIFESVIYPWEIIPKIEDIIKALISDGIPGFSLIDELVLAGKGVRIADGAQIVGPAVIGHGSTVRHGAFLRGSVIVGNGCTIGNSSEIKNSILMDGAQAPHFNYVGDSVLGEGAHLGAGVICSNLRLDRKTVKIKDGDASIDTGLRKLGAMIGDSSEIGCGAILCPGTIIGKSSTIYPRVVAKGVYPCGSILKSDTIFPNPR